MTKLQKLKDLGLIGCLNDPEITSENYKEYLYGKKSEIPYNDPTTSVVKCDVTQYTND